jgi:hypothetical protein
VAQTGIIAGLGFEFYPHGPQELPEWGGGEPSRAALNPTAVLRTGLQSDLDDRLSIGLP